MGGCRLTSSTPAGQQRLTGAITQDLAALRKWLEPCGDITFRLFQCGVSHRRQAALIYSRYLVDVEQVTNQVLEHLMLLPLEAGLSDVPVELTAAGLPVLNVREATDLATIVQRVGAGESALIVDGAAKAILMTTRVEVSRQIAEPATESVVRGPREAFVEMLEKNINLLRRRLPTDRFRMERRFIGDLTRTQVALIWLDGIADPGIVQEARNRLSRIEIDGIIDSGYLEELIEDSPFSPFPHVEHTERADKCTAALLEGRVAVIADGSPYSLLVPGLFVHFMQASEDYYERFYWATAIRWIRVVALFLALLAPSIYVAIAAIHQEMIPIGLLLGLAANREGAPFPIFLEALMMEIAFELLREAGLRLPGPIGQAVSIVGGLVVGEAAVRAGIANPITVVVVATTGIASFAIPAYNVGFAFRLLRFPLLIITATLGLPGLVTALMVLLTHMSALRSFGVPYLAPLAPADYAQWKDVLVRAPWWAMLKRARFARRTRRMAQGQKPRPPAG